MKEATIRHILAKVKKDYTKIAKSFDESRAEPFKEFELFFPYLKENDRILDVGCGNGRLAGFLKNKIKIDYLGIDNNRKLIGLAKKRHPFAKFKIADMGKLPFHDHSFDHVWDIAAFHHIPSKKLQLQTLKEMKRVLTKGGLLIITVWNLWQKKYRKYKKDSNNDTFIPWKDGTMRYYHAFTVQELQNLLKKSGFKIISHFYSKYGDKTKFSESYNICFVCRCG